VCAWGACNLVEWSTCGHTPPGKFTEIGVWNCDQLRSLRFHRARQEVWLCGFGDPGQHRDHGSWSCRRAAHVAREGTRVSTDLRQISDFKGRCLGLFRTSFVARRPPKSRAVPLKSIECAVWPAAPAPHPQHNDTPQRTGLRGHKQAATTKVLSTSKTRLSTCVTSTSDELR
jgi:hypothetical protein